MKKLQKRREEQTETPENERDTIIDDSDSVEPYKPHSSRQAKEDIAELDKSLEYLERPITSITSPDALKVQLKRKDLTSDDKIAIYKKLYRSHQNAGNKLRASYYNNRAHSLVKKRIANEKKKTSREIKYLHSQLAEPVDVPEREELNRKLAELYEVQENWEKASKHWEKTNEFDRRAISLQKVAEITARKYETEGWKKAKRKDYNGAAIALTNASEMLYKVPGVNIQHQVRLAREAVKYASAYKEKHPRLTAAIEETRASFDEEYIPPLERAQKLLVELEDLAKIIERGRRTHNRKDRETSHKGSHLERTVAAAMLIVGVIILLLSVTPQTTGLTITENFTSSSSIIGGITILTAIIYWIYLHGKKKK